MAKKNDTIFVVIEDNHGEIAYAHDYDSAINFLLEEHWIDEDTDVYCEEKGQFIPIKEVFGEHWADEIRFMSRERFNDFFDDGFGINVEKLV